MFHGTGKSGNVVQNTGSYALKAGMLMKLKVVSASQVVGGGKEGSRCRVGGRWGRAADELRLPTRPVAGALKKFPYLAC